MSERSLALRHPADPAAVTPPGAFAGTRGSLLHLVAMVALMYAGMMVLDPIYEWAARLLGSTNPAAHSPMLSAIVMTTEMTLPMIPFMRWHGHSRRHIAEMAGAMAAPSFTAVGLHLAGAIPAQAVAGVGHAAMIPAMLAAMLYRRRDSTSTNPGRASTVSGATVLDQPGHVTQGTGRQSRSRSRWQRPARTSRSSIPHSSSTRPDGH